MAAFFLSLNNLCRQVTDADAPGERVSLRPLRLVRQVFRQLAIRLLPDRSLVRDFRKQSGHVPSRHEVASPGRASCVYVDRVSSIDEEVVGELVVAPATNDGTDLDVPEEVLRRIERLRRQSRLRSQFQPGTRRLGDR